jgi:hypothetical protein
MTAAPTPLPELEGVEPREFGIGARLTLVVAHADHAAIVHEAVTLAASERLVVTPDDVSVHVSGADQDILQFLATAIGHAAGSGAPVVATLMLSRGCPGGVVCALPPGGAVFRSEVPELAPAGVAVRGQWALYPLDDGGEERGADHMRDIYAVLEDAKARGTVREVLNYVTTLDGDLAEVLQTVGAAWVIAGRSVQHVATHLTLWANAPAVPASLR